MGICRFRLAGLAVLAAIVLPLSAFAAQSSDPYVLLDEAKIELAEGNLNSANEMFDEIRAGGVEEYIQEELAFQQMLLDYAFLSSVDYLLGYMYEIKRADSSYAMWLKREWSRHAGQFQLHASEFMDLTENGQELEFVRFRLPRITKSHIEDLELFADEMMLTAAMENWEEGNGGLGRAMVNSQARVSLVLASAVFYDREIAGASLDEVADRLDAGVLLSEPLTMDWIARNTAGLSGESPLLLELSMRADERLLELGVSAEMRTQIADRMELVEEKMERHAKPATGGLNGEQPDASE